MLIGLDPTLSPDLLYVLRAMGHGDEIVIADANFPAESTGQICIRMDASSATQALEAILSVMPLDTYVACPAHTMQVVDAAITTPPIVTEFS